jgi:hypothetical protein
VGIQTTHPVCCSLGHPPIRTARLGLRLEFQSNVPEDPRFRVCMYHAPVEPSARIGVMHLLFLRSRIPKNRIIWSTRRLSNRAGTCLCSSGACSNGTLQPAILPTSSDPSYLHPAIHLTYIQRSILPTSSDPSYLHPAILLQDNVGATCGSPSVSDKGLH